MTKRLWKIGELAEITGLSVRALHYYEEIGLLVPSRTESGHRLYDPSDLARLQQIVSLKQMGLPLEKIGAHLARPDFDPLELIRSHARTLEAQAASASRLREQLLGLARFLETKENPTADDFLRTLVLMRELDGMYTEREQAIIRAQGEKLGEEGIRSAEQEWPRLIAAMKEHQEKDTNPADPAVRTLARRWKELVEAFTGGDPGIAAKLKKMYEENPDAAARFGGLDRAMMEYVNRALEALG